MSLATFNVKGMNCSNCVDIVRSSVGAVKGVKNVKVDFDSKQVKVDFNPAMVQEQQIRDAITSAGYSVQ
ncbi:MAG: copper chaperone [Clostridiales bacterium]|jgi:copper chaperone|nr:copper chaperone [Clostridiales bacterium]MDK2932222.1 copper chaperone [Clostridiales bacterium]